jgi:hypothetical protein
MVPTPPTSENSDALCVVVTKAWSYFVVDRWKIIENVYSTMLPACLSACLPARLDAEVASGALLTLLLKLGNFPYALTKVICKVTLSFTPCPLCFHPCPLFQWYLQSKEIFVKSHIRCPIMPKLASLAPKSPDFTHNFTQPCSIVPYWGLFLLDLQGTLSPSSVYLFKQDLVKDRGTPLGTPSGWRVPERNDDRGEK